jgi:hypothetical protein
MICQPAATRKDKRRNGPGRPPDPPHPWRIGLPVSGSRCGHRQSPGTGGRRRTLPPSGAGARTARSRRSGLQRAMPARPCPGCPAVPAGAADAGLREQDRAETVNCIRRCPDRTDICTATTRGVVSRQTEYDAAVTRALLEACVATCKSCGEERERHPRPRAFGR